MDQWTTFLTQKLCQRVADLSDRHQESLTIPAGTEVFWVESLVQGRILHRWEAQDEPEHL